MPDGTVDDDRLRRARQRAGDAVAIALLVEVGPHRGDDHGHVVGPAPRHHRVDGHVLGGHDHRAGRDRAEHGVGLEPGGGQELVDQRGRGRHDGEAVGPPPLVVVVEERGVVAVLVLRCLQSAHTHDPRALRRCAVLVVDRFRALAEGDAVDERDAAGAHRRHAGTGHHHADQVERVGGVDGDPLTGAGSLADLRELLERLRAARTARR